MPFPCRYRLHVDAPSAWQRGQNPNNPVTISTVPARTDATIAGVLAVMPNRSNRGAHISKVPTTHQITLSAAPILSVIFQFLSWDVVINVAIGWPVIWSHKGCPIRMRQRPEGFLVKQAHMTVPDLYPATPLEFAQLARNNFACGAQFGCHLPLRRDDPCRGS